MFTVQQASPDRRCAWSLALCSLERKGFRVLSPGSKREGRRRRKGRVEKQPGVASRHAGHRLSMHLSQCSENCVTYSCQPRLSSIIVHERRLHERQGNEVEEHFHIGSNCPVPLDHWTAPRPLFAHPLSLAPSTNSYITMALASPQILQHLSTQAINYATRSFLTKVTVSPLVSK